MANDRIQSLPLEEIMGDRFGSKVRGTFEVNQIGKAVVSKGVS